MKNLRWFHAFNRSGPKEILAVLKNGPRPAPTTVESATAANEDTLGLAHCVYAYLGRSSDLFGKSGFVFPLAKAPKRAQVSPFDTGGLVAHISPVKAWKDEEKGEYAKAYTWSRGGLNRLLNLYPGATGTSDYVAGVAPNAKGPHEFWSGRGDKQADIWNSGNDWPAWTWELRTSEELPAGFELEHWTTTPHVFGRFQRLAESATGGELPWYEHLARTYVDGGITQLMVHLRDMQVQP